MPAWVAEWEQAAAVERLETAGGFRPARVVVVGLAAVAAAVAAVAYGRLAPGAALAPATCAAAAVSVAAVLLPLLVGGERARPTALVAGVASVGAALIHFAVAPMHLGEYLPFGVLFVALGIAQLAWGIVVVRTTQPLLLAFGAALSGGVVAVWVLSRTWGLPLGPDAGRPEALGAADALCSALELLILCCCALLLTRPRRRSSQAVTTTATAVVFVASVVALLSAVGAGSSLIPPAA